MGANVSKTTQEIETIIKNTSNYDCTNSSTIDNSITGFRLFGEGLDCGDITIGNRATTSQVCDLDIAATAVANAAQSLATSQELGLALPGANVDMSESEIKTVIENTINAKCGNATDIKNTIDDAQIILTTYQPWPWSTPVRPSCDSINVINEANVQQQCISKLVLDAANKVTQEAEKKQKSDALGSLGNLALLGLSPCIIIVIIIIIGMLKPKKGSSGGEGSALDAINKGQGTGDGGEGGPSKMQQLAEMGKGAYVENKKGRGAAGWIGNRFKEFTKNGGGGSSLFTGELPIFVVLIMALVWYGVMTDPRRQRR